MRGPYHYDPNDYKYDDRKSRLWIAYLIIVLFAAALLV